MKNIRIVLFIPFIYGFGGVERLILALSKYLYKQQIQHEIVCFNKTIDITDYANWPISVIKLSARRNPFCEWLSFRRYLKSNRKKYNLKSLHFDLKGAFYSWLLPSKSYNIHLTDPPSLLFSDLSKFAPSLRNIYGDYGINGKYIFFKKIHAQILHLINKHAILNANSVIVMTKKISDEIYFTYNVEAKIIRPGIKMELESELKTKFFKENFRFVSVCRLEHSKRINWIINSLASLEFKHEYSKNGLRWYFDVIGNGSERSILEALASKYGLNNRVIFHGNLSDIEMRNVFYRASLFIIPAIQGYGLPALEALAHGIPGIIHCDSGVSEILSDTPWVEIIQAGESELTTAIHSMVNKVLNNQLRLDLLPKIPSEEDWARNLITQCQLT